RRDLLGALLSEDRRALALRARDVPLSRGVELLLRTEALPFLVRGDARGLRGCGARRRRREEQHEERRERALYKHSVLKCFKPFVSNSYGGSHPGFTPLGRFPIGGGRVFAAGGFAASGFADAVGS